MREAIVAVFDNAPHTEEAVKALLASGIEPSEIRRYKKGDPGIPPVHGQAQAGQPHETKRGFWAWLRGDGSDTAEPAADYDRDYPGYIQAMEAGGTVLAVTVDETESQHVMQVLADKSPVELEESDRAAPAGIGQGARSAAAPSGAGQTEAPRAPSPSKGDGEQTIPLAEENLSVSKRQVDRGTTRVHRYVVEKPVEQQVNLRDEHVEVERRKPVAGTSDDQHAFEERTVETRETSEEPVVRKTTAVPEEVVVRRETTEHPETVHDTVRKDKIEVENPRREG